MRGYLTIAPLLFGCVLFYAVPFLLVCIRSLSSGTGASQKLVGLRNYRALFRNAVFLRAFGNTMKFLAISLPLILVLSFAIALVLKELAKKHQWLKSVILMPYIMPVAGTVLLIDHLFAAAGFVNSSLYALGLPVADWLHSGFAFPVVILLYLWKNTGYSVILLLSGLTTIPKEQYAAASIDGVSRSQQLRYITLPQMWYSFFFAAVFSLINAFKSFREIFLIGGTHPHDSIYMLQHFINNAFENMSYPKLATASVLLLLVILVAVALLYRLVLRKEAYKR